MKPCLSEYHEQATLMHWAEVKSKKYPELALLFAVPNAGMHHVNYRNKLRQTGLKAGIPDLILPVARQSYHGLFIELKRRKNSHTSEDQKAWIAALLEQGYQAVVCKGWEMAAIVIKDYLGMKGI